MTAFTTSERREELRCVSLGYTCLRLQLGVIKLSKQLHAADDVSALCLSITNVLSGHWFPSYISQERQHFAAVTPCLGEICATCHLSDTHRTEKSQIRCVLSKSESEWEEKIQWETETGKGRGKERAKCLLKGRPMRLLEKQQKQVIITALLQLHKRSSVWNQARAASFCFRKQHRNRNR